MSIANGIWPTMITPYTSDNRIDYGEVERLVEWYAQNRVSGIFAMCQSSEMYFLSERERLELIHQILRFNRERMDVVVAGTVDECLDDQIEFGKKAAELGPQAVVFIRNRLSDDFAGDLKKIMRAMPADMPLGMYECPYPFRRFLTDDEIRILADTGRFVFLKDTVCDINAIRRRAELVKGSAFQLYNANAPTFYESIRIGYHGYSGIMANFHPDLYVWVYEHMEDPRALLVEKALGMMSLIECRGYPICCKQYLSRYEGFAMSDFCRSVQYRAVPAVEDELRDLHALTEYVRGKLLPSGTGDGRDA